MITHLLIPLLAAMAPFMLWPIEFFLPYPYIIEELAKALLIFPVLKISRKSDQIILVVTVGVIFALSESVLYLANIFLVGDISTFLIRFGLTIPFHALTALVIWFPAVFNRKFIVLGLIAAGVTHYIFNLLVG